MKRNICWFLFLVLSLLGNSNVFAGGFFWPIGTENYDTAGGSWLSRPGDGGYIDGYCHIGEDMMTYSENAEVRAPANDLYLFAISTVGWSLRNNVDSKENVALLLYGVTAYGENYVVLLGHISRSSLKESGILPTGFNLDNVMSGTVQVPGHVTLQAGQFVGRTGFYRDRNSIHLHVSVWIVPKESSGKNPFTGVSDMYKETSGFGRTPVANCSGYDRNKDLWFKHYLKPSYFFKSYTPHSTDVADTPVSMALLTSKGLAAWNGEGRCGDASLWWFDREDLGICRISTKEEVCGAVNDSFAHPELVSVSRPGFFESIKQDLLGIVPNSLKSSFASAKTYSGMIQMAKAAGISLEQYVQIAPVKAISVRYADGLVTIPLAWSDAFPNAYGRDIQATSPLPQLSTQSLGSGTEPRIQVTKFWIRLKSGDKNTEMHDLYRNQLEPSLFEWRVQLINVSGSTKKKGVRMTVQVFLWKVKDDGGETLVEPIGTEVLDGELKPGGTTTASKSPGEVKDRIKWAGKYFLTVCVQEDGRKKYCVPDSIPAKSSYARARYDFSIYPGDLEITQLFEENGKSVFLPEDVGSFHASFESVNGYPAKDSDTRVAWKLFGPSYPDGYIVETDRIKATSFVAGSHGENTFIAMESLLPGEYRLVVTVNPECKRGELERCSDHMSNNSMELAFTRKEEIQMDDVALDRFVPCSGIMDEISWQESVGMTLGYLPPYDGNGTLILQTECMKTKPNSVDVYIGNKDVPDPKLWIYPVVYVNDQPHDMICFGSLMNGMCQGAGYIGIGSQTVNTSKVGSTWVYAYTSRCESSASGPPRCENGWRFQTAYFPSN